MQDFDDLASNTSSRHSRANALGAGAANSSKQLVFPEPTTTKLLTKYFPLFPILLTFKRANLRIVSTIGLVLFAMQHWAFVLNPHMKDHLGYQLGNVIAYIVYGSQLSFYDPVMVASASVTAFLVVVYLLLAVTLVLVGCILFHLRPMDDHSEGKGITSDAARLLLNVMSTALLIPILQFCFASCVCGSSGYMWMLPNVENAVCWGSSHIAAFIPSLICLIMLIPLLYLKNTCVYDYAILSDTFQSRRHSVVEKMTFVRDVMSCLLFNVMLGWEVPLGFTILHAIFSAILVLSYMFFLPYYSMWMNRFYVCVHTIECLISVFVSCSLNNFSLTDGDATTALFLGVGSVICLLAAICTDIRINPEYRFALAHASQCYNTSANWEVESDDEDIDASEDDLHFGAAAKVDDDVVNGLTYPKGIVQNTIFCQYAGLNRQVMESIAQQEINMMVKSGSMGVQKHKTYPVLEPYVSYVYVDTDIALAASSIDLYAMRFEPEQLSDMMLVYGANLYSRALTTFADNAEVMLAFAAFITSYLPGLSFMGVDLVKRSLRGRVTTDQQFRCLRQSNELRTALGIRTHSHAMFSLKARSAHGKALQSIHKFWVKLTEPSVNIKEVSEVADTISERCDVAIAHFESALRNMRGADHVLLRRLGDFFSEVMMAPDAAQECNSEARDIYEARQARSMRGTRQHTQLEVDSAALSERMMALLQYHRRGGSVTSRNSVTFKLMKAFALAISVLFLCLIACSCLFIVCATLMSRNMDNFMECTKSVADLMIASSRFSSNVLIYLSGVTGSAYTELMELQTSLMRMFVEDFKFISSGGGQPQNDVPVYMMTKNTVPFYQVLLENTNGVSLWALGELYLQAMLQFVKGATDEGGAVVGASWNELFLINTGSVVSTSFLTYLETYASKELPDFANLWTGLLLLIFLLTIAFVSLIYFGIASAFQKVALSRVFIFQLFTLIPFDTLERLAVETKEKYHRIEIDKSFKHSEQNKGSRDEGMMATIAVEEKQAYQFMHGDVQVRSCLKPGADCSSATRTHGERRVHFNPVIEVVGQKDEHPDDKKAGDRFDADEDDMSLTLQQSARSKKDKHNDDTIEHKTALFGTLLFFIAAVASTVTLIALLAMNLTEYYNVYYPDIRNYLIYRTTLIQISQSVVMTNSCLRRFILSGSLVDFRNANAYIATAIQSLPSLMGPAFTSDATVKLVRMHFLLQLIGNLTFDAGVLSAKFHNSSLSDWSMLAQLYDLPADTLLQYMEDKYPAAKSYAAKVMDSTGGDVSEMIVVALIIQNLDGVDYASEFHQLYFDVVAALSKRMARIVDMRSPLLLSSLIISAVMTAIPLVIMALPTRRHILQYFGFRHMISTAAAFGFILIVCGLMEGEGLEIIHVQSSYKGEFAALNDYLNAIQQRIGYSIGFIITAKQLFWFDSVANDPTIPMVQLSDALMSNLITPAIAKNFSRSSLSADRIMELSNISTALAIHSMKDLISLEEPILDALNHSWWDIRTEVDYLDIIVKYPMPVYYNTSESDLLLTASEQYQIALNVMCGPEFFNAVETFSEAISSLYYSLCDEEYHRALHCVGKQKILGIIGLSLCILPALACIWMGTTALALVKEVLHVNATTSHQTYSADAARYHTMLRRAQVVLIFLAFLYAITFAVGVWITQIGFVYSTRLSFAARQGAYLSQSLHYILMVLSSYITYISLDQVSNALTSMLADVNNFYLGETSMGIPVGLQVSRQFDEQQLGFADLTTALPVMLSYLNTPCNKRIAPKPLALLDANYLNELEHPVVEGLMTWTALMGQITSSLDNYATAAFESQVATALPKLQVLSSPLQDAVENSTVVFHSRMSNITDNFMGVLLGFAVATIVLTVLTFLFVIVPTIIMLLKEDESVGMLLRLIPVSVHEEVPAIAHFLVTGDTSNSSEMYQKFEANEKLLQNILPEKIAARLKSGEQPIADTHDCVTMLFTDFVGFTKRSSTMQAREIVDFLNEVFLEFDTVVELLSLEKIKTIGDAFFMAAGLDAQMRDHALRVVEAGLMFFEALEEHNRRHPSRVPLQMRLGVHSGPVVAGVIGIKKVAYDLWGDSVEIANAMESTGVPGYVHISESTAELVRGFFKLEPRGELPREKEHIPDDMPNTYLVVGRLLPTPYMHLRRPKLGAADVSNSK